VQKIGPPSTLAHAERFELLLELHENCRFSSTLSRIDAVDFHGLLDELYDISDGSKLIKL